MPLSRHNPEDLAAARRAIAEVTPAFTGLLRGAAPLEAVIGSWGIGEIACHVSHVFRVDTDALAGRPLVPTELTPGAVAALNDAELANDSERNLTALAARVDALLADFLLVSDAPAGEEVTWLDGVRIPASAVACHLLEELLVHGFDIAAAGGNSWPIENAHAALALAGAAAPIINAADRMAFINEKAAQGFRARIEVRLRGHDRLTFVYDEGLRVEDHTATPADVQVSAEPASMLLVVLGRVNPVWPILRGKITFWGRRPWQLARMLRVVTPP